MSVSSVLVWHPGTSMSTSDVCDELIAGLAAHGVHVDVYPMDVQIAMHGRMLEWLWQENGRPDEKHTSTDVLYKAAKELLADACRARRLHGTEWVIVVSGMYQHPDMFVFLRDAGFKVAVLLTESPYDTEREIEAIDRRAITGACEPVANVVFTNERTVVDRFRVVQPRSYYLPHAWNPARLATVDPLAYAQTPSYDVVFVGTYFEERVAFLADIDWRDIRLGLYGTTDELRLMARSRRGPSWCPEPVRRLLEQTASVTALQAGARQLQPHVRGGYVPNVATQALYRRAKVGLNFHRTSKGYLTGEHIAAAESMNPRCYELAAAGCFFVSDPRAELLERLPMVPTARTSDECAGIIRHALADPAWRMAIAAEARKAVADDTWTARAGFVLEQLAGRPQEARAA